MSKKRRQYSAQYKFQVAMEAAKGNKTLSELSSETGIHPNQISGWKRQLLDDGSVLNSLSAMAGAKNRRKPTKMQNFTNRSAASRWNWSG